LIACEMQLTGRPYNLRRLRSLDSFLKTLPKILSHEDCCCFQRRLFKRQCNLRCSHSTDNPHQIKKGSCERAHGDYAHLDGGIMGTYRKVSCKYLPLSVVGEN
jgi:hypothetical protein